MGICLFLLSLGGYPGGYYAPLYTPGRLPWWVYVTPVHPWEATLVGIYTFIHPPGRLSWWYISLIHPSWEAILVVYTSLYTLGGYPWWYICSPVHP